MEERACGLSRRAVIFDLDDTLYPLRRFVQSGFAAVADHLGAHAGAARARARFVCWRAPRGRAARPRTAGVPGGTSTCRPTMLPELVDVMRAPPAAPATVRRRAPGARRAADRGWRIGMLTNGPAPIQARKVSALGLTLAASTPSSTRPSTAAAPASPTREPFHDRAAARRRRRAAVSSSATTSAATSAARRRAGMIRHSLRCVGLAALNRRPRAPWPTPWPTIAVACAVARSRRFVMRRDSPAIIIARPAAWPTTCRCS